MVDKMTSSEFTSLFEPIYSFPFNLPHLVSWFPESDIKI